jgi:ubiquinone/menaquinone biosynthesis C-methylase UbiE
VVAALDLRAGQCVVDVGYGPRSENADMEEAVAPSGSVVSIDLEGVVRAQVRERGSLFDVSGLWATYRLPVEDRSVDRVQADRVLHHVDDSLCLFAELARVLRPGGLACITEPDWESLIIDPIDSEINQQFNRFVSASIVRNATFGRQVARLAEHCGFTVRDVLTVAPVLRNFKVADRILGLSHIMGRAVSTGRIRSAAADQWLAAMDAGPFLAAGIVFTTVIQA